MYMHPRRKERGGRLAWGGRDGMGELLPREIGKRRAIAVLGVWAWYVSDQGQTQRRKGMGQCERRCGESLLV